MNIVAIGLGNFGASLAKILTSMGHDVLGVDNDLARVEYFKDAIANTICLDATDSHALRLLPIREADVFVVCISDDFGISVKIAALLIKMGVTRVICRESSSIHLTVLQALGAKETVNPEYEYAKTMAEMLPLKGIHHLFSVSESFKIVDLFVPESLFGQLKTPANFRKETHLKIVALKRNHKLIYSSAQANENTEVEEIEFHENDTLVLAGEIRDIKRFLQNT